MKAHADTHSRDVLERILSRMSGPQLYDLGRRIATARMRKRWSRQLLGELCDCSKTAIRLYEAGDQRPKLWRIELLAEALGVGIEWLLFGRAEEAPGPPRIECPAPGSGPARYRYAPGCLTCGRTAQPGRNLCAEHITLRADRMEYVNR